MILGFKFQTIKLRISKAGQRLYFRSETDRDYSIIKGISLNVGNEDALYGSTFGFRVEEKEVLNESHEAHLLVFSYDEDPNQKMLFFEIPIPVHSTKIEGIYTDTALQGLLSNTSSNPNGGIISPNDINIAKTYVSGKDVFKFNTFAVEAGLIYTGGLGPISIGGFTAATPAAPPVPIVKYPYDVQVRLLLLK